MIVAAVLLDDAVHGGGYMMGSTAGYRDFVTSLSRRNRHAVKT
jgi:hypothetical protein